MGCHARCYRRFVDFLKDAKACAKGARWCRSCRAYHAIGDDRITAIARRKGYGRFSKYVQAA